MTALGGLIETLASFLTQCWESCSSLHRAGLPRVPSPVALTSEPYHNGPEVFPFTGVLLFFTVLCWSSLLGKELLPVSCLNETNRAQGHSYWAAACKHTAFDVGPVPSPQGMAGAMAMIPHWDACLWLLPLRPVWIHLCSRGWAVFWSAPRTRVVVADKRKGAAPPQQEHVVSCLHIRPRTHLPFSESFTPGSRLCVPCGGGPCDAALGKWQL